jgi:hypothetical protein
MVTNTSGHSFKNLQHMKMFGTIMYDLMQQNSMNECGKYLRSSLMFEGSG